MTARLRGSSPNPILAGVKLVLSILAALAVLLMPAGMGERGAAMAATHEMAAASAMDHCTQKPEHGKEQPPESCCLLACSALPPGPSAAPASFSPPTIAHVANVPTDHDGLSAEAATPPPRTS